jgi:transposase
MSGDAHDVGQVVDANVPTNPDTVAQCHVVIDLLAHQVDLLRQQLALQDQKLAVLQERLSLDSKNSSKLPSSDGPASPNRAERRASGRKRAAQSGHKGSARAMLDELQVDPITDCAPVEFCDCGAPLTDVADEPNRHQFFDVPPIKAQVNEYRWCVFQRSWTAVSV